MNMGWFRGATGRRWFGRIGDEALMRIVLCILVLALMVIYFAPNIIISIPAGYVGVLWSRFGGGTVTDRVYEEGIHLIFPWDKMVPYDARAQHVKRTYDAITLDGLGIKMTVDVRYHIKRDEAGFLHKYVGEKYVDVVIDPRIGAFVRAELARYTAEEIYSRNRRYIEHAILEQARTNRLNVVSFKKAHVHPIAYDDVLIHAIELPEKVRAAIESKVVQFEAQREWEYRVEREKLESQRRVIEANATKTVLDTLGDKLTDRYLQLRGIDAMVQLATSPNAKVVVMGPGAPALPLVMGGAGTGQSAANAPGERYSFSSGSALSTALPPSSTPQPSQSVPAGSAASNASPSKPGWWRWLPFSAPSGTTRSSGTSQ
jgi:regulator of protease activity HflC (stomatin/prohibitin superfamily)